MKGAQLTEGSGKVFTVQYHDQSAPVEYTYDSAVAREKKVLFMAPGSPAFQQILNECLENGAVSQIIVNLKDNFEELLKALFKDSSADCQNCSRIPLGEDIISLCQKPEPCYHQINNAKISSLNVTKKEPTRFFRFYFSAIFQNKLRPRNEELLTVTVDEKGNVVWSEGFDQELLEDGILEVRDLNSKLKALAFDDLKSAVDKKLNAVLQQKLALFDLPLSKEKKAKLKSFDRRVRRAHLEQLISKKSDFDAQTWQNNYGALWDREEETLTTNITVKLVNLLVINTSKVCFEVKLDNNAALHSSIVLGVNHTPEVVCPTCRNIFFEGYATQDGVYLCRNCIRQSVDTAKVYSKKASLKTRRNTIRIPRTRRRLRLQCLRQTSQSPFRIQMQPRQLKRMHLSLWLMRLLRKNLL